MAHHSIPQDIPLRYLARGATTTTILRLMVFVGLLSFVVTVWRDSALAWQSYVVNWTYFASISLGGVIVAAVTWITKAKWNWSVRRIHHSFAAYLPFAFVLFIPMLLNLREDYFPWIEMMADDPIVQKEGGLSERSLPGQPQPGGRGGALLHGMRLRVPRFASRPRTGGCRPDRRRARGQEPQLVA